MLALKGEDSNFPDQVNLKDFRRLFDLSRFGNKANKKIGEEFKVNNADFANKQFVRIIGNQLNAEMSSPTKLN